MNNCNAKKLTIRLPNDIYEIVVGRASHARLSMNQYILMVLTSDASTHTVSTLRLPSLLCSLSRMTDEMEDNKIRNALKEWIGEAWLSLR